uniref:Uncharacterized protein n=1 Tax=Arundo donax TaxID=35708 RepID=A0A0A9CAF8_ARUDO
MLNNLQWYNSSCNNLLEKYNCEKNCNMVSFS